MQKTIYSRVCSSVTGVLARPANRLGTQAKVSGPKLVNAYSTVTSKKIQHFNRWTIEVPPRYINRSNIDGSRSFVNRGPVNHFKF